MFKEFLLIGGSELTGGYLFGFKSREQAVEPFLPGEQGCEEVCADGGAAAGPIREEEIGDVFAIDLSQSGQCRMLQGNRELRFQESAQQVAVLIGFGEAASEQAKRAQDFGRRRSGRSLSIGE